MSENDSIQYGGNRVKFDIYLQVIVPIIEELKPLANTRSISIHLINDTKESSLEGDKVSIEEIVRKLIENAIKFSSDRSIEISLSKNFSGSLIFRIKDFGQGLTQEFIEDMFLPFFNNNSSSNSDEKKLSDVKRCCNISNALLVVETNKKSGFKFTVIFPDDSEKSV